MYERFLEAGSKETGVQKDTRNDISLPDLRRIYRLKESRMKIDQLKTMIRKRLLVKTINDQIGINDACMMRSFKEKYSKISWGKNKGSTRR